MEEVKAVVDEARHKLPVVAHAHRPEEIRRGSLLGADCFEHTGSPRRRVIRTTSEPLLSEQRK